MTEQKECRCNCNPYCGCVCHTERLLCDELEPVTLQQHTAHVEKFLNELYAVMVDPVEQPFMKVAEMCELLLRTAREHREKAHALQVAAEGR